MVLRRDREHRFQERIVHLVVRGVAPRHHPERHALGQDGELGAARCGRRHEPGSVRIVVFDAVSTLPFAADIIIMNLDMRRRRKPREFRALQRSAVGTECRVVGGARVDGDLSALRPRGRDDGTRPRYAMSFATRMTAVSKWMPR